jgi:hypothetical protein
MAKDASTPTREEPPVLAVAGWRLCAGLSVHNFRYWKLSGSVAAVPVRLLDPGLTEPTRGH